MKLLMAILLVVTAFDCKTISKNLKQQTMIEIDSTLEKFDFEKYEREGNESHLQNGTYIYRSVNRAQEYPTKGSILNVDEHQTPPLPYIYNIHKEFYTNGNIKNKGKLIWDSDTEIGLWYYFDEHGNLIKSVNEDEKFGKFGYNELLHFLDKEHVINIRTGENREELKVFFDEIEKFWIVEVYNKVKAHIENGERDIDTKDGFGYKIDGHTGKVLYKRKQHYIQSMGRTEFEYIIKEPRKSIIL